MTKPLTISALLVVFAICITPSMAMPNPDQARIYNKANALYAKGDYEAALELYNSLNIANPDLEYNRASAYLKTGDLGKATLHFQRALRLRPGDEDTIANLKYISSIKPDREPPPRPSVAEWIMTAVINPLPLYVMTWIWLGLYIACSLTGFALLVFFDKPWIGTLVKPMVAATALTIFWGATVGIRIYQFERRDRAVAVADKIYAHTGPSKETEKVFTFHSGTVVKLGRVNGSWVFITLSSGYSGWAPRSSLERI